MQTLKSETVVVVFFLGAKLHSLLLPVITSFLMGWAWKGMLEGDGSTASAHLGPRADRINRPT